MLDQYETLQSEIITFSKYLDLELKPQSKTDIYEMYAILLNEYKKIDTPIDLEEIIEAIINIQKISLKDENKKSKECFDLLILRKIQKSIEFQLKNYTNDNGKSLMFKIVNNALKNKRSLIR